MLCKYINSNIVKYSSDKLKEKFAISPDQETSSSPERTVPTQQSITTHFIPETRNDIKTEHNDDHDEVTAASNTDHEHMHHSAASESSCHSPAPMQHLPLNDAAYCEDAISEPISPSNLLIQLAMNRIGVSIVMKDSNDDLKLVLPYGQLFIPPMVGRTMKNHWVIGKDLESGKGSMLETWPLATCMYSMESGTWSKEIVIGELKKLNIKFEFLFGVFLALAKNRAEKKLRLRITKVNIIVPMWLASVQRQQLKTSGKIAGFKGVHLINENYFLAQHTISSLQDKGYTSVVVISENSGKVDITVHSVNMAQRVVSGALVHTGDYEQNPYPCHPWAPYGLAGWPRMWKRTKRNLGQLSSNDVNNNNVDILNETQPVVCVAWRSGKNRKKLIKFAGEISLSKDHLRVIKPGARHQILFDGTTPNPGFEMCGSRDGLAYSICMGSLPLDSAPILIENSETREVNSITKSLPTRYTYEFYETSKCIYYKLGEIHIYPDALKGIDSLFPQFGISSDGIVTLNKLDAKMSTSMFSKFFWGSVGETIHFKQFDWKDPGLEEDEIVKFAQIARFIIQRQQLESDH